MKERAVLEMSCTSSEYKRCDYQQKSGECVIGCAVEGGQTDKKEQCK